MGTPRAGEFSQLFVIFTKNDLVRALAQVILRLDNQGSLDQKPDPTDDTLLLEGVVADDLSNGGADLVSCSSVAFLFS